MYEFHPLASIFPLIDGAPLDDLVADVRTHGVREPIWLLDGQILDGRNRYRAALAAGIECPMREYTGESPVEFVISLNLHRRHLNESQRAMVAAKLANMAQGARTDVEPSANLPKVSQPDAARLLNVSTRSVTSAAKVRDEAPAPIAAAVEQGRMPVSLAAKVAALPKAEAEQIAAAPSMRKAAQAAVKKKTFVDPNAPEELTAEDHLLEARQTIRELAAENDELRDRAAVEAMEASEEAKTETARIIAELRTEVKTLSIENAALRVSRDIYMRESAEKQKQINYWRDIANKRAA